eukprot:TRINITY_DN8110_c0_g1_i1.p1 TRINITY_DN8110_c0_g1~~TRINITY_DN8110_c0_g1_i1.p1  ORF type:complete len:254 (+),score=29.17 TRINITY_DN8110_c0_g1_i1:54-764(+)
MRLILGLGNPGMLARTQKHNAGHIAIRMVLDELGISEHLRYETSLEYVGIKAERWHALLEQKKGFEKIKALNPKFENTYLAMNKTYMNLSGPAAKKLVKKKRSSWGDLMVIHDDMDLPLTGLKQRPAKPFSNPTHNGLRNILLVSGNTPFTTLRIGIGKGNPLARLDAPSLYRIEHLRERIILSCMLFASDIPLDRALTFVNTEVPFVNVMDINQGLIRDGDNFGLSHCSVSAKSC